MPPHRMLSRGLTKEQTPTGPSLHSNLGRYRIPGNRRIRGRNLETTPTIHHPLLHNSTPPRRSSTKSRAPLPKGQADPSLRLFHYHLPHPPAVLLRLFCPFRLPISYHFISYKSIALPVKRAWHMSFSARWDKKMIHSSGGRNANACQRCLIFLNRKRVSRSWLPSPDREAWCP